MTTAVSSDSPREARIRLATMGYARTTSTVPLLVLALSVVAVVVVGVVLSSVVISVAVAAVLTFGTGIAMLFGERISTANALTLGALHVLSAVLLG